MRLRTRWPEGARGLQKKRGYAFIHQMAKLSAKAKVVHARYGTRRTAAVRSALQKARTVNTSASHSSVMSARAAPGDRRPKKSGDHAAFSESCTRNMTRGFKAPENPPSFAQTIHADRPIRAYNRVQTGPNMYHGGVHEGFSSAKYHAPGTNIEPTNAARKQTRSHAASPASGLCVAVMAVSSQEVSIRPLPLRAVKPGLPPDQRGP